MAHKFLIVDDESTIRELFVQLLTKENHEVKAANSAEEAWSFFEKEDFNVVLLDIKLPGASGFDLLQKIKAAKPNTIVIMITGFGYEDSLINKCKDLGCSGYIGKNMPVSQIMNNIKLFINAAKDKQIRGA